MTNLGVDLAALESAADVLANVAADFGGAGAQVRSMAEPAGSTEPATALLARSLAALAGALSRAETSLRQTGDQLASTAATYARTEQLLSAWKVPGGGSAAGGSP